MTQQILRATLDVPFECAFRDPDSMNALPTYSVPPVTTLQGMLYAALARPSLLFQSGRSRYIPKDLRDDEEEFRREVQDKCQFGIRVIEQGKEYNGLKTRQKMEDKRGQNDARYKSYVTNEETLIEPTFRIYITENGGEEYLDIFKQALEDPSRMLYLGRSDDIVDVCDVHLIEAEKVNKTKSLDCVVPSAEGEHLEMLPVEPDHRSGRSTKPPRVKAVSIDGAEVGSYYRTSDGEEFVFIT
ncbi:CRISPR-associated protein Cas5 [Halorutilales archaeon Cl-col2-1]